MKTVICFLCCCGLFVQSSQARPTEHHEFTPVQSHVDVVGDVTGNAHAPHKATADTTWIATWNFEGCDDSGWVRSDNRILNDGNIYWQVNTNYDGWANIDQEAAVLTSIDPCTVCPLGGYSNDWYQGIRLRYVGDSYLSFDYLVDSEGGYDFLQVESDSVCSSFSRVDYDVDPEGNAAAFRNLLWSVTGFDTVTAHVDSLLLSGYASADTHCAYIAFYSDGAYSCSDGLWLSVLGAGAVVDNILIDGADPLSETFSGFTPSADIDFVNMQDSTPFGVWARLFQHISDNDLCTENPTCAWLSTDDTTPTLANDPSMAFGPGGFVLKNWLDEVVVGPWVSLASTASAFETVVQFRRFPGNFFGDARFVQNWSLRGRTRIANPNTPTPGDSIDCISGWGHASQWNSLSTFAWITNTWNATTTFDENSRDIQMRLRISDWQWIAGAGPSSTFRPGPGPFWDRVRIGRRFLSGPMFSEGIDARWQAQDAAPNDPAHESGPLYAQAAGGDIFGTTAFSRSADLATGAQSANLVVGDSITVVVEDVLGNGGLNVEWHAAIVAGPHAGKSPAPYPVGPNGFFAVPADTCRRSWNGAIVQDSYFIDLDDTYFRGGDALRYFWWATDAQGGTGSLPEGLTALPASVHDAESATGGLYEVDFLPSIVWDASYLARVAADAHGDLDPTPTELANSEQFNCILYYENVNSRRRSGDLNRTSFMYTLDKLGYRGQYDVYDHMGLGNTNNALGARMSPEQARNYSLLVYDAGNRGAGAPILPDGSDLDAEKIDMSTWFQDWCALSGAPNAEHTLWILGSNVLQEKPSDPLFASMAVTLAAQGQGQDTNPDVFGIADFASHTACVQTHVGDQFALDGGCPVLHNYDDIRPSGTGVQTHVYGKASPSAAGAIVMHANAGGYTTILSSFPWFDIAAGTTQNPTKADEILLSTILSCVIPIGCQWAVNPTDTGDPDAIAIPPRTALRPNTPNPFNPVTTIHFDLAREGQVSLKIYDVAGRRVRTLTNGILTAGFDRQVIWDGLDDNGKRVGSGIYFSCLVAGDVTATRKLVVLK